MDELSTYGDTFDRFSSLVNSNWMDLRDKTNLRYGQVFFNTLFDMHPRLADDIRSTHRDPFHKDEVNMEIWDYCSEKWDTTDPRRKVGSDQQTLAFPHEICSRRPGLRS